MLTLLQISSTRVFLKTLLTTTDSQRLLSLICFFGGGVLSKSIKVHLTISLRKQMDCIKKIKTFSLASSSPHFLVQDICCIFVLGTWVTRWKEKKTKYFTVHHWCTSEYTISGTDEEDASVLNQEDSHTHACKIFSSWRKSKCRDSKSKQPYTAHI